MHDQILEYLYNEEGHTENDILDYLMSQFPQDNAANRDYSQKNLEALVHNELILLTNDNYGRITSYQNFNDFKERGFIIQGHITFKGKNYVEGKRRDRIQNELNLSFKKMNDETIPNNNRTQTILTIAIGLAALASAFFAGVSAFKHNAVQDQKETLKVDSLLRQQDAIKSKLFIQEKNDSIFHFQTKNNLEKLENEMKNLKNSLNR